MLDKLQRTASTDLIFWQEWQKHRDHLYGCCLKILNGNQAQAEDALSEAMLKAREELQKIATTIKNFKAWLTTLTCNLCKDFLKKRDRLCFGVEDSEWVSQKETPALAATRQELELFFEEEVNNLSPKLRETFLLHWNEGLSHREIAERLKTSYNNVSKRLSNARAVLRRRWGEYEETTENPRPSLKTRRQSNEEAGDVPKAVSFSENTSIKPSVSSHTDALMENQTTLEEVGATDEVGEFEVVVLMEADGSDRSRETSLNLLPRTGLLEKKDRDLDQLPLLSKNAGVAKIEHPPLACNLALSITRKQPILWRVPKSDRQPKTKLYADKAKPTGICHQTCCPVVAIALSGLKILSAVGKLYGLLYLPEIATCFNLHRRALTDSGGLYS